MKTSALALLLTPVLLLSASVAPTTQPAPAMAAFTKDARVLFQGDSITDGNRGRSPDPNHVLGHGYVFLVAAKFGSELPRPPPDLPQPRRQRQPRQRSGRPVEGRHPRPPAQRPEPPHRHQRLHRRGVGRGVREAARRAARRHRQGAAERQVGPLRTLRPPRRPFQGQLGQVPGPTEGASGDRGEARGQVPRPGRPLPESLRRRLRAAPRPTTGSGTASTRLIRDTN